MDIKDESQTRLKMQVIIQFCSMDSLYDGSESSFGGGPVTQVIVER